MPGILNIELKAFDNKFLSRLEALFITILSRHNLRVCELLRCKRTDLMPGRYLIIPGAKGSCNVIIRDKDLIAEAASIPASGSDLLFYPLTYNLIYRDVKRYYSHLFVDIKTRKNQKVTHAFRYLAVRGVVDVEIARDILHHRSSKSSKYYLNKFKGK